MSDIDPDYEAMLNHADRLTREIHHAYYHKKLGLEHEFKNRLKQVIKALDNIQSAADEQLSPKLST
jgi:hypothetical protein